MALNANALTTLAQAKAWLKIPVLTVTDDALVELMINAASQTIESETNRKLLAQSIVELRHGKSSNIMMLREWPINSITELKFDLQSAFTSPETLVDPADYTIGDDKMSIVLHSRQIPRGYNNVRITYNAGYAAIPSDLEMACLWMVSWFYQIRKADDIGRTAKGKGDESTSWSQAAPEYVTTAINKYKRTEMPTGDAIERNQ